jgi:hypothetical protein
MEANRTSMETSKVSLAIRVNTETNKINMAISRTSMGVLLKRSAAGASVTRISMDQPLISLAARAASAVTGIAMVVRVVRINTAASSELLRSIECC